MSFCIKCGSEYDEKTGVNFCGRCGFDLRKTSSGQSSSEPQSTPHSQQPANSEDKPIAGIIVALVLGIIGLLWTCAVLFQNLYGTPNSIQATLNQIFPSLQIKAYLGLSLGILGNAALIIGALMSHMNHPKGVKAVRFTSYLMIISTALASVITYFAVTGADAWLALDAPTKGALIGGLVGGTIGAFLQWGLILFLFRQKHGERNPEPEKVAFFSGHTLFHESRPPLVCDKLDVEPTFFQSAAASHKCPNCSIMFKLGANISPNTFVTCPVCFTAFSPSATTLVA